MHSHARSASRTCVWILMAVAATVAPAGAASVDGIPLHWTSAGAGPRHRQGNRAADAARGAGDEHPTTGQRERRRFSHEARF